MTKKTSLLLDLPLPFKKSKDGYLVELQALNGLKCWSDNFEKVTVCAPVEDEGNSSGSSSIVWANPRELLATRNIVLEPLPMGYHPRDFIKHKKWVYDKFCLLIEEHEYLCFSNIGGIGSWGNYGVDIANKKNKKYALWFDWVIEQMPAYKSQSILGNIKSFFDGKYAKRRTYYAIRNCDLGLFHGKTVYDAYAPYCKNPQLVHDIHLSENDAIVDEHLNMKVQSVEMRSNIKIGYLGRAHPMKAPEDWIEIVSQVFKRLGKDRVEAVWLGDGPLLESSRRNVETKSLNDVIKFKGFVSDRQSVLKFLQEIDVFLFCHVTPESPRCLIEALISGTPIVGYKSAYASDLVGDRGGALLSEMRDTEALVGYISALANDRKYLCSMIKQAAQNKSIYNDKAVFKHRSDLIKAYL
jgi:colanic acid/amylovoran biosynthesis glycosyltransferase